MYNLSNIALAISDRELSRKELKHYLKYHLKAFAANYLNNRSSFTEDEFNKETSDCRRVTIFEG